MSESPYEQSVLLSLRRITRAIDLYSKQLASRYKLTGPQLVCLRQLYASGPTTPSALARAVSLSQGTISGILDRLERQALVVRRRSSEDKRRVDVELTVEGRKRAESSPSPLHETFARRLAELPGEDQVAIDQMLRRIVVLMEADDLDAAPMMTTGPTSASADDLEVFLENGEGKAAADPSDGEPAEATPRGGASGSGRRRRRGAAR